MGNVGFEIVTDPSFASDILCIILLLNLLIGNTWQFNIKRAINKYVLGLIVVSFSAALADILFYEFIGSKVQIGSVVLLFTNSWIYIATMIASFLGASTMIVHHSGSHEHIQRLLIAPLIFGIGTVLVNLIHPFLFEVTKDNFIHRLSGFYITFLICAVYILLAITYYFIVKKHGGILKFFPIWLVALPVVFAFLSELLWGSVSLAWCSIAIALVGIFSSMQKDVTFRDSLTGLYNRMYLDHLHERLSRSDKSLYAILVDLNEFKLINDTFGHSVGDQALVRAARILESGVEEFGSVCRFAGDEFIIIMNITDEKKATERMQLIKNGFHKFNEEDHQYKLSASMGLCEFCPAEQSLDEFIHKADVEMYRDKHQFYEIHPEKNRRKTELNDDTNHLDLTQVEQFLEVSELMEYGFEKALEEGQFVVYYQPQYNQREHSLYGAEALIRWIHPQKGMISPAKFIPYLENNGMITMLDEYVLHQVCKQQRIWHKAGWKVVPISVNLSRIDFKDEAICKRVKEIVESYEIPISYINIEITESAYIEHPDNVIYIVKKFQDYGFKIEMDDFGSGYSSLNSLKDIPVDILKLDMKFVGDDTIGGSGGKIISSVVRMAHWLGMPVIAEGVENKEQADFLREVGCYYIQGYYFDKPLALPTYEQRLKNAKPDLERDARLTKKNETSIDYLSNDGQVSLLLDNTIGAASIMEYDGTYATIVRANDAFVDLFGISPESIQRELAIEQAVLDGDASPIHKALRTAIDTMDNGECECLLHSGFQEQTTGFWALLKFKYIRGYDDVYTFYSTVENIDAYKKAVQSSHELYKVLDQMEKNGVFGSIMMECKENQITITYFNDATAQILGYEYQELKATLQKDSLAVIAPQEQGRLIQLVADCSKPEQNIFSDDIIHICKDGSEKKLNTIGVVYKNMDDVIVARFLITDIEQVRNNSNFEFTTGEIRPVDKEINDIKKIYHTIEGPHIRYSRERQRVLEANRAFCEMLGYTEEEFLEKRYDRFDNMVWKEDKKRFKEMLSKAEKSSEKIYDYTFRLVTKNGTPKWVSSRRYEIDLSNGQKVHYITYTDIDEIVDIKSRLERLEQVSACFEDNLDIGCAYYRIKGKRWDLEYASKGYLDLLGYTFEQVTELTKNDILALIHPEDRESIRKIAVTSAKKGEKYKIKYRLLKSDGEYMWFTSYGTYFKDGDEGVVYHINLPDEVMSNK